MIREMIRFQIRRKIAKGESDAEVEIADGSKIAAVDAFIVTSPEISTKDQIKLASALQQITTSLMIAEQQDWVTKKTAANVFANNATALGMEVEAADIGDPVNDGTGQVTKDYSREGVARVRRAYSGSGARHRRRNVGA